MVSVPFEVFKPFLQVQSIYYFKTNKITSDLMHNFVLIGICSQKVNFIFLCCTSQFAKRVDVANKLGWDYCTIVPVPKGLNSRLNLDDTCVDCNNPVHFTINELEQIYNTDKSIVQDGTVSDGLLQQMYKGFHESTQVAEWQKDHVNKSIDE